MFILTCEILQDDKSYELHTARQSKRALIWATSSCISEAKSSNSGKKNQLLLTTFMVLRFLSASAFETVSVPGKINSIKTNIWKHIVPKSGSHMTIKHWLLCFKNGWSAKHVDKRDRTVTNLGWSRQVEIPEEWAETGGNKWGRRRQTPLISCFSARGCLLQQRSLRRIGSDTGMRS